jgi:hypothetical protein
VFPFRPNFYMPKIKNFNKIIYFARRGTWPGKCARVHPANVHQPEPRRWQGHLLTLHLCNRFVKSYYQKDIADKNNYYKFKK